MVYLVQCLCPARHCITALAFEPDGDLKPETAEESLKALTELALARSAMNPWCAICRARSSTWVYECARTRFRTMAEARPELKRLEAEQAQARSMFEGPGRN